MPGNPQTSIANCGRRRSASNADRYTHLDQFVLILRASEKLLNEARSLPKFNDTGVFRSFLCFSDRLVVVKRFNDLHPREISVPADRIINAIFGDLFAASRF